MDNKHAARDCAETTIDGVNYRIRLLNTSAAYTSFQDIAKLLLPAGGAALDGSLDSSVFEGDQTFATSAMLLVKQMGEIDILSTIKLLLEGSEADDAAIDFEEYFKGNMLLLVKLLEFAIRENYGSLFIVTGLKERLQTFIKELTLQTQEPQPQEESDS